MFAVSLLLPGTDVSAQDQLVKEASWQIPSSEQIESATRGWLEEANADPEIRERALEQLRSANAPEYHIDRLEVVLQAIQFVRPEIQGFLEQARKPRNGLQRPDFSSILDNEGESQFVRQHVRLLYARWLTQNDLLDEALEQFKKIDASQTLDPVCMLFYRGVTEHQLLKREECIETLKTLLENEAELPRRYAVVGRMMAADIEPLEADSLDEISRMMKDIRRRQALFRSGKRVRSKEEEVIKKLDKIIEEIEQQRAAMQQQQPANSMTPSSPMEDSQRAAGKGSGEVIGKQQVEGGNWGALPPAERAAAMAEMSKDLPPHYRAVIEEYFRKLARDDDQ